MPKWGIEMTEGTVTGWRVTEGQRVERGAEILDVETEKIVNAVEAPFSGVLRRIMAQPGETHAVGVLIGVIADDAVSDSDVAEFVRSFIAPDASFDRDGRTEPAVPGGPTTQVPPPTGGGAVDPAPDGGADETRVSPIARRIAERLGIDLGVVKGTGRNGRISKEDVEGYAASRGSPLDAVIAGSGAKTVPAPTAGTDNPMRRVRMSARRSVIGRRLLESKQQIPHYRLSVDVDFGRLLQTKRERTATTKEEASVNDWLLRAAGLALVQHPMVNAQLEGDEILQFENADIAIAVAAEAGLVTPILRSANLKSLGTIARESRDLVLRARAGTLRREEISGGSFTISNLGMQGITAFDAIINAPQVAILAVGAIGKRAVVRGETVGVADMGTLTMSADHRVVDGAVGAAFLTSLAGLLERPEGL